MKKSQHVVPHVGGWAVKSAGSSRASSVRKTQAEAIKIARGVAKNQHSELFVHDRGGQIRARDSFGNDPYPPKG